MTDLFRDTLQTALGAAFQLDRELGGGGMSRVFVARDTQLGRDVVVKVLSPELTQELSVERFGREIALAAALQHANIVPVLSAGVTSSGLPYYLMPFVDGESLRGRIDGHGRMPIADVLLILTDVCRALAYAHARGVVHRDIKPDNVMLSGGAAMVTDFGIAKAMTSARTAPTDDKLTRLGISLGSPAYMAPEQGAGDPATDYRADLYALGAMAYDMLSGAPPFGDRPAHAQLIAHLAEAPVHIVSVRPDTPDALASLVMSCLEKDPDARPRDAAVAIDMLADAATTTRTGSTGQYTSRTDATRVTSTVDATPSQGARTPTRRSRIPFVIGAAISALLALSAIGWFVTHKREAATGPDRALLAVMPFTVRDASLDIWREGLVDILSRSLDGAGTLRTVAASTSIARAPTRADVATATAHGRALGAGLVLFGDLSAIGRDSVRARVSVVDVSDGSIRHEVDVRGETTRIDALADTLSLRLLRQLSSGGELGGGSRLTSIGTTQLPALKAYLRGLQLSRRAVVDSTLAAFQEAVALDSTFSLAWRGVASVYIRTGREATPDAQDALDRAIRFRRGGSPRDSMLLRGDSLRLAVVRLAAVPNEPIADIPMLPALFQTLSDATQRYPSDAELWLEYGDALFHFGAFAGIADSIALRGFERAIALDSNVLVPQFHASTLQLRLGNLHGAAARLRAVARLSSDPQSATYLQLQATLLDSSPTFSGRGRQLFDSVAPAMASAALREISGYGATQSLVTNIVTQERTRLRGAPSLPDSALLFAAMASADAMSGKIDGSAAARLVFGERQQLAQVGMWSSTSVVDEVRAGLRANQGAAFAGGVALLAAEHDTTSLALMVMALSKFDTTSRATGGGGGTKLADVARAYTTLARGDTSAALTQFLTLPTATCRGVPCAALTVARLLVHAKRESDAARVLDRWLPSNRNALNAPPAMLLRAEIAARAGDNATAKYWFDAVAARWGSGGAAVQPTVRAAREGLSRLGARP